MKIPIQQAQIICITFVQRRSNVFNVGPTLYKCYTNVLCLLGICHNDSAGYDPVYVQYNTQLLPSFIIHLGLNI